MRDKDGRILTNAHVLGFLRRISKLLFYGIKPVFVFDGGAPAIKRNTINARRKKKSGAVESHAKVAEKLLAAQMRREAVSQVQAHKASPKGKAPAGPTLLEDETVYLEDIDPSMPKSPAKRAQKQQEASSSSKRNWFYDHDPYRLPELDYEQAIANATRSTLPDPRLATEEELRAFIEELCPDDFDVTSPEFRELPTEIQYEIVGDLRLKSRQTSFKRLQNMLKNAPTAMDFSQQQIVNLKQRNALTQQLLTTTDSIGKANISIPVRIASERNKEYVLIKNEGREGGWTLGIGDGVRQANAIDISTEDTEDDSDMEMEEVAIPSTPTQDPDLREYTRNTLLTAIAKRSSPQSSASTHKKLTLDKLNVEPLFTPDEDDDTQALEVISDDEDLAVAIQASYDNRSRVPTRNSLLLANADTASLESNLSSHPDPGEDDDDDDLYTFPTADLATQNAELDQQSSLPLRSSNLSPRISAVGGSSVSTQPRSVSPMARPSSTISDIPSSNEHTEADHFAQGSPVQTDLDILSKDVPPMLPLVSSREQESSTSRVSTSPKSTGLTAQGRPHSLPSGQRTNIMLERPDALDQSSNSDENSVSEFQHNELAKSPLQTMESLDANAETSQPDITEDWDPAHEIDPHAEEGEFARFMSQVKGKGIAEVRRELDDEIATLHQQRKAAMRDSEDITQQMVAQIMVMLRLFGIPYITAPMEAEAQCAELVSLGLVDGVITDDSDVFLFGAIRVFKNMFNQSKTVECFLLSDLERELGLTRDALIRLAYLLGSDYVEGLPGVGPVMAMELFKEFPGEDGLHKFSSWWSRVQTGKDTSGESKSKFRQRFKKQFKDLYLSVDWPDPTVRDAYYHPTVDSSEEPFKWGLPDLDGLRMFFKDELGWNQGKVDDLLLPIIHRMGKRGHESALNKQGNLNEFFDITAGSGTYAPRKRQVYASKRLQHVVSEFRSAQAKHRDRGMAPGSAADDQGDEGVDNADTPVKKRAKTAIRTKGKNRAGTNSKESRSSRSKTRTTPHSESDSDGDMYQGERGTQESLPALRVELRPRRKGQTQ